MPRANRFYLPGLVWHITHRCHDRQFLLKAARDRQRWRYWLYQAKARYGLRVLNYVATSNHVHLLVQGSSGDEIARAMQLSASRIAQEYNRRKGRRGAFWEDRYFATAISTDEHLARCLVYIDLNMVRAGAVKHPAEWDTCGYRDIQWPRQRFCIIDLPAICQLTAMPDIAVLQRAHRGWVESALAQPRLQRQPEWTESIAVGSRKFVQSVTRDLGYRGVYRSQGQTDSGTHFVREDGLDPDFCD
jgi:putative transposase